MQKTSLVLHKGGSITKATIINTRVIATEGNCTIQDCAIIFKPVKSPSK